MSEHDSDVWEIERAAVIGGGTMGHGIAQVAAMAGWQTRLFDIDQEVVNRALKRVYENLDVGVTKGKVSAEEAHHAKGKIKGETDLDAALDGVDIVIEAVPEKMDLKQKIFRDLGKRCDADALLATNTSSLSITEIASACVNPARVCGMHFFNPVHILPLCEVIRAEMSSDETIDRAVSAAEQMLKHPIVVKDSPGFASSRLGVCLGLEAIRMVEEGVASAEDIDLAMTLGYRHPMGPLKLGDLVGLDIRLNVAEYLWKELGNDRFEPPALLRTMVAEGKLGKKTGQGFYEWT